tara:strand:- start:1229 stop:2233 length:1005 start_codon:yes stop_codon:yes gene_type:complete
MKKVFITGADGFIGSHLVEKLVKSKKYKVKALVLYNHMNKYGWLDTIETKVKNKIEIISGDIKDYKLIKNSTKNCDIIINLAALIGIPYSYDASQSYIETNIVGTHNILNAAIENSTKKIIQTSTSEVFGSYSSSQKLNEKSYQYAQSPYAATKIASDQLCNAYFSSYNLPVTIVRPFNTFGPRQSIRAIIPTVINQILDGKKEIKLGNIVAYRDFNYVADTAEAFIEVINSNKNLSGETFNFGSSYQLSIKELVYIIAKIMKVDIKIVKDKTRIRPKKSEVLSLLADSSKAKKTISWKPKYTGKSGLVEGLKLTIDWFKINRNQYQNYEKYVK